MEYLFVLVICPIFVIASSLIVFQLTKKWFVMPIITFVLLTIVTFTLFNSTFFGWAVMFTILSGIISFAMRLFQRGSHPGASV